MEDDDLDRLLSDIDSESDYKISQEDRQDSGKETEKQHYRITRKRDDGIIIDSGLDDEFALPDKEDDVLVYKNGILNAIKIHETCLKRFQKNMDELAVPDNVQDVIQKSKYTFLRHIEKIDKLYNEYQNALSPEHIQKKAKKDFNLTLEGFEEDDKLEFIILKEIFFKLREMNLSIKEVWSELSRSIGVINLISEGRQLFQNLDNIVKEALGFCDVTDKLIYMIASTLGISSDNLHISERDIAAIISYSSDKNYNYDSLFETLISKTGSGAPEHGVDSDINESSITDLEYHIDNGFDRERRGNNGVAAELEVHDDEQTSDAFGPIPFTVRGTTQWNTREPYIIKINYEKYEKDLRELKNSFYFINYEERGVTPESSVKRAMMRYLSNRANIVLDQYEEFIFKTIISVTESAVAFFGVEEGKKNLFIYHLGPGTLFKQILAGMQEENYGVCFRYLNGNRVVRYIPGEFIKGVILRWFEENINSLDMEFDKVQLFNDIKRLVSMKYNQECDNYLRQLNDLVRKLKLDENPSFDSDEYFKSKWNDWFGRNNIIVYNRLLEKTIFK